MKSRAYRATRVNDVNWDQVARGKEGLGIALGIDVGKYDLWLDEWEKAAALSNDADLLAVSKAARAEFAKGGYRAAIKRAAEVLQEQSKRVYIDPAIIAGDYGVLGDKDKAFFWLEKSFAEKSDLLRILKSSSYFDSLRSDPRYANILRRMNLPQ